MTELFRIETERLLLVWSGPPGVESASLAPFPLREQTPYLLFARSKTGAPVVVEHRDPVLLRGLMASDEGRIVHGTINFGSQVGRSELVLRVGGEAEATVQVEVFPTKLNYAEDYQRLVADTQRIHTALVLEYLRSTLQPARAEVVRLPGELEWLLLLRHAMGALERALEQIARHPQRGLASESGILRAERVRRPGMSQRRAVARGAGSGGWLRVGAELAVRERLQDRLSRPTLDTPEHRWLAAQLRRIRRRLTRLRATEAKRIAGERHSRALDELNSLERRLARCCTLAPLVAAEGDPPPGFASLQLLSAPGYAEAYRAILILDHGVNLGAANLQASAKELHLLYEQWCFLALVQLLTELTGSALPSRELVGVEAQGLRVRLRRGQRVRFVTPDGRRIRLAYNPRFGREPLLVPQQPDLLLDVRHPDGSRRRVVLDAKYRLDSSLAFRRRYGAPGPPEEALNTLHRYRDAVGHATAEASPGEPERAEMQAVALFPFQESELGEFRRSRLWTSIRRIGIGAIPLLPGGTEYLAEWLGELVREKASL